MSTDRSSENMAKRHKAALLRRYDYLGSLGADGRNSFDRAEIAALAWIIDRERELGDGFEAMRALVINGGTAAAAQDREIDRLRAALAEALKTPNVF